MRIWVGRGTVSGTAPAFTIDFLTANNATNKALLRHRLIIEQLLEALATTIEEYANGSPESSTGTDG